MNNQYAAVMKKDGDWGIEWIEEVPRCKFSRENS